MNYYSYEEIQKHCFENDGWIIANNYVYDITKFLDNYNHPIPKNIVLNKLGTDCTIDINFHGRKARKLLEKYKIGKLKNSDNNCTIF